MPKSLRERRKFVDGNSKRKKLTSKRCRMSTRKISTNSHKYALLRSKPSAVLTREKPPNPNFFHMLACDKESLLSSRKAYKHLRENLDCINLIFIESDSQPQVLGLNAIHADFIHSHYKRPKREKMTLWSDSILQCTIRL